MNPLILASLSPRRRELLDYLELPFQVVAPNYEEKSLPQWNARQEVEALAREKAESVVHDFPDHTIIAADTLVTIGGEKLGKPVDAAGAIAMLQRLAGKVHEVVTGVYLCSADRKREIRWVDSTSVYMKSYDASTLRSYVRTGEPMGKAGAYAIQGKGEILIEKIVGDYFNVVGLPLASLQRHLQDLDIHSRISLETIRAKIPPRWHHG